MEALWQGFMDAPDYYERSPMFPNPAVCIRDMVVTGSREVMLRLPLNGVGPWLNGTWYWMSRIHYNDPAAIMTPVLIAILITLLRVVLNWALLKRIAKWAKLTDESAEKFPESVFKTCVYTTTSTLGIYLVVFGNENNFFNLRVHWDAWEPDKALDPGVYWLYMTEMGFYLHSLYAMLFMETIRRDFKVMMAHHVLTIGLLLFSYFIRFHSVGLLLLSLYDVGDMCLEAGKVANYLSVRGGKKCHYMELTANTIFGLFTLQHIVCRLYWYPVKVIYSSMHISVIVFPDGPYYLLFIPMLWSLYAMQVFWFVFIAKLLWKILVLGEELHDNREEEEKKKTS